jgi:integrase
MAVRDGEYVERWLKDSVRGTVRQSTYEAYEYMTYPHIVPSLGRVKLKVLTPVHVRSFYREKLDGGLSSATVRKMHGVLQKALDQVVSDGLIPRNAAKGIRLPQGKKKEIRPLSPDEASALLVAARGDRLEALYLLAISTGLREGELLALRWEDVNLEAAVLRVSRTLTRNGGKVSVGPPKTQSSRRAVGGLTADGAVEALREHLTRQLEEMERMGSLYRPGGLIFANEVGGIVNPSNLRNRSLKTLLERAVLPAIHFHDLRHTCATLLLSRNVNPKIVSEMLGHASIAITLDTYSHVLPNMQQSAVRALEEALK